jgi:[acyl-carrier-protein] S-malonyltransferase
MAEAAAKEAVEAAPPTEKNAVCVVANDNAPGQVVISGTKAAVERAGEIAKSRGAKRAMLLNVSAPFHSPLMQPAADKMREALSAVTIRPPAAPVLANVTANETSEPEMIRRLLVEQVTGRVRWRESVLRLKPLGIETTVELGGAKVLTGMVKRIDRELANITLDAPSDVEAFAKTL